MQLKPFAVSCLLIGASAAPQARAIVSGAVFDRFVTIWLENTNYATAVADPNLAALAAKGIQLTNYFGLTHPSEPNYVAAAGGEYFGMNNDNLNNIPANISTLVDLLEDKGVSWAEYEEGMPSAGYTGASSGKYVRKHNPLIIYNSVSTNPTRAAKTKTFTQFQTDLANNALPQWMFITPDLNDDGHDTGVTFAGNWIAGWLNPLLTNPNFNTAKTLILIAFDETSSSTTPNRVDGILLGGAVPTSLVGTSDTNFYTHYSEIATIEANWGLHTLGRYDVGANVFAFVAAVTGDTVRSQTISAVKLNKSYPGQFNTGTKKPWPVPNTSLVINGRTVLPAITSVWGTPALQACTVYSGQLLPPDGNNPPVYPPGC